ncbi:MAG: ABC transporter ATP-binding protein [Puniceicoccales bacterium]|jgi:ABC-type lipoprotein export system ATPase subunit|nr:ABC transporter ATP-binding protein [Puniceicoccales bacterium]
MALLLKNVFKAFGREGESIAVLKDVSVEFANGESVAIIGVSGCGKTTLLNIVGGLLQPDMGEVLWDGYSISDFRKTTKFVRGSFLGFIFQNYALVNELTILENILLPSRILGSKPNKDRAKELLTAVHLEHRMQGSPMTLSGGEKQRAAIVRALIHCPKFVIADEPTGNLDERTSREVEELMFDLCGKTGAGLIYATHDHTFAQRASRIISINAAKLHHAEMGITPPLKV